MSTPAVKNVSHKSLKPKYTSKNKTIGIMLKFFELIWEIEIGGLDELSQPRMWNQSVEYIFISILCSGISLFQVKVFYTVMTHCARQDHSIPEKKIESFSQLFGWSLLPAYHMEDSPMVVGDPGL